MTQINWTHVTTTLGELQAWDGNPKKSTKKQKQQIAASFDELGQFSTVAISPDGDVYDGHQRLSALLAKYGDGYEVKALRSSRPLTDEERRKIAIYSRQIGAWDWDELMDWDIDELTDWGFDEDMLADLTADGDALGAMLEGLEYSDDEFEDGDAEPEISRADELRDEWGVETGQVWILPSRTEGQEHRLICGDCTDEGVVEKVMGGDAADILSIDVPYGLGFDSENQTIGNSKKYGAVVGDENTDIAVKIFKALRGFCEKEVWWGANHWGEGLLKNSSGWLVWDKDHHGMTFADAEIAWTSVKIPIRVFRHAWSGNHRASEQGDERYHINQKPIALYAWYLELLTQAGAIVFDGCLGGASQLIAAENSLRQCRAVEISPAYIGVALQRYFDAFGIRGELQ